ncbi:unnamed protein product [Trichobilharzia regenti]|nr:unnamed protein product [Trichobilharzia regenti]
MIMLKVDSIKSKHPLLRLLLLAQLLLPTRQIHLPPRHHHHHHHHHHHQYHHLNRRTSHHHLLHNLLQTLNI